MILQPICLVDFLVLCQEPFCWRRTGSTGLRWKYMRCNQASLPLTSSAATCNIFSLSVEGIFVKNVQKSPGLVSAARLSATGASPLPASLSQPPDDVSDAFSAATRPKLEIRTSEFSLIPACVLEKLKGFGCFSHSELHDLLSLSLCPVCGQHRCGQTLISGKTSQTSGISCLPPQVNRCSHAKIDDAISLFLSCA